MIDRAGMMEPMLRACPSFQAVWDEFVKEWKDSKELPLYLVLGDLARHIVTMLEHGDTQEFQQIFDVIELWHTKGDPWVQEAATIGLLEDLQNTNLYLSAEPEELREYLGPESLRWWNKVHQFWEGKLDTRH